MRKRIILPVIFILLSAAPLFSQTDAEALLLRAEKAFGSGNELLESDPDAAREKFGEAVICYNSIIESGLRNAGLYYNLANAYFRLDDLGNAVLNYRRALIFDPGDQKIQYNLEYARMKQKNGYETDTGHEVLQILFFWHKRIPLLWKAALIILFNAAFFTALVLKRLGRKTGWAAAAAGAVLLVLSASAAVELRESSVRHGVVTAESTTGRLGDSRSYEAAFDAPIFQGAEFTVRQQRVGWILAELPGGDLVWLERSDCGIIEDFE